MSSITDPLRAAAERHSHEAVLAFYALGRGWPGWSRHVFAVVVVAIGLLALARLSDPADPFSLLILLVIPITLAALVGGLGPGLLATAAATLGAAIIAPDSLKEQAHAADLLRWGLLMTSGMLISFACEALWKLRRDADADRVLQTVTLRSIGDAVITTDAHADIILMNDEAERLTGWSAVEAAGQPLETVYRIVDAVTRRGVPELSKTATGEAIAIRHQAMLTARDGRETAIEETASPIRDESGAGIGAVIVFHDVGERLRAAAALRESEVRYRNAIDAAELGTWRRDLASGRIILNERARVQFDQDALDTTLEAMLARVHPDDRQRVRANIRRATQPDSDGLIAHEYRVLHRNGTVRWLLARSRVEYRGSGAKREPSFVVGAGLDITEQRLRRETLEREAMRSKAMGRVRSAYFKGGRPESVFALALTELLRLTGSRFGFVAEVPQARSGAAAQRCLALQVAGDGEAARDLVATTWFDRRNALYASALSAGTVIVNDVSGDERAGSVPADHPRLAAFIGLAMTRGDEVIGSIGLANRDGGYDDPLADYVAPVVEACAQLLEAFRSRGALAASEARANLILDTAPEAMLLIAPDGRIERANRRAAELFGAEDAVELIGIAAQTLVPARWGSEAGSGREPARAELRALETGAELDASRLDRSSFPAEVSIGRVRIDSRPYTIAGVIDITRRKEAEQLMQRLNAELERRVDERTAELQAANEELDAFSYAVAHDLRAPLRAMNGFSRALAEDYGSMLDGDAHTYLDQIQIGSRHMSELIDGLLALSRTTKGQLEYGDVDLSAIATRVCEELARAEPERRVDCRIEPGLVAHGDARLLEVVLQNLLGNAWKYSARRPDAQVRIYAEDEAGERWFCVADNGAGFDMSHADRLFKPFQRLHRKDEFAGIGIGLATVQRIVRRHGGTIEARAEPGRGALFRFTLRAGRDAADRRG